MPHPLIDYILARGWDDDAVAALEQALATPGEPGLEEALALLGERYCPAREYCEMVALLL